MIHVNNYLLYTEYAKSKHKENQRHVINVALYLPNSKYNSTPIYDSYYEDGIYVTLYITSSLQLFLSL